MMIRKHKIRLQVLPSQQRFLECQAPKKGFSGPVGSGKTVALCYQAVMSAIRNPNCDGIIGGPTYPMLRDVTVKAMLQILDEKDIPYTYLKQERRSRCSAASPVSCSARSIITSACAVPTLPGWESMS